MKPEKGCSEIREEFRKQKFGLHHEDPSLFIKPQCLKPKFHLIWVTFWLLFYAVMLGLDVHYAVDTGGGYFIFLTNWSYLLQAVYVVLDFAVTIHVYIHRKDIREGSATGTPVYIRTVWIFFNITNVASLLITLLYYIFLEPDFSHSSVNKHLLNSVYTLLNLSYSAKPVQILHVYQPVIFACVYVIFSLIYHALGNEPIYPILDWNKPGSAALLTVLSVLVGVPVFHLVCFALYTLRLFVSLKCQCKAGNDNENMKGEVTTRDVELQEATNKTSRAATNSSNAVRPEMYRH